MRRLSGSGLAILAVLAAATAAACGGATASSAPGASTAASTAASAPPASSAAAAACAKASAADPTVNVDIKDFKFAPDPVTAKVGEVIVWTNGDGAPHTASLSDGTCSTDNIAAGAAGALVFSVAGTYTYQCNIHPGQMKGYTITITE